MSSPRGYEAKYLVMLSCFSRYHLLLIVSKVAPYIEAKYKSQ